MRFLLDTGSGTCLWRQEVPEEAGFAYAIDHTALGLSANTVAALQALIGLADLRIDWSDPTAAGPYWRQQLAKEFELLRARTLADLERELATLGFSLTVT